MEWLTCAFPFEAVWTTAEALSAGVAELPPALSPPRPHYQYLQGRLVLGAPGAGHRSVRTLREQVDGLRIDSLQGIKPPAVALPLPIYQPETLLTPQTTWLHDLIVGRAPGSW